MKPLCVVASCFRPQLARGWCGMHYQRWLRTGDLREQAPAKFRSTGDLATDLASRVDRFGPDDCWPWNGPIGEKGYGDMGSAGRPHVVAYRLAHGPIPKGWTVDHLCHDPDQCQGKSACLHRRCCNPAHLGVTTRGENTMRGGSPAALNARKTHCWQGHAFDSTNTYVSPTGSRQCRTCNARKSRAIRTRRAS